jgi:uncharacterized protein YegP (UPF0339 family)
MYFRIYIDEQGEHRWTLHAEGNRKTLADSGEGYKSKEHCISAIKLIQSGAEMAIIVDSTIPERRGD